MSDTPNQKPTFSRKTISRITFDKNGNQISEVTETVINWPKSKVKQEIERVLQVLGDLASNKKIAPYTANRVGYIIKNLKSKYNEKKWYIPYVGVLNYTRTKEMDKNTIEMIVKVLNNKKLQLDDSRKNVLTNLLIEKSWECVTEYFDESMIPEPIFKYLTKNPKNLETIERLKKEKSNIIQSENTQNVTSETQKCLGSILYDR